MDKQPEPKCQRLILLIDYNSHTIIKEAGYNVFTGDSRVTIKVLKNLGVKPPEEEEAISDPTSSKREGDDMPTPSETRKDDQKGAKETEYDIPLNNKPATA